MNKSERRGKDSRGQCREKAKPCVSEDHHAEHQKAEAGRDVAQPVEGFHPSDPEIPAGPVIHTRAEPSIRTLSGQQGAMKASWLLAGLACAVWSLSAASAIQS